MGNVLYKLLIDENDEGWLDINDPRVSYWCFADLWIVDEQGHFTGRYTNAYRNQWEKDPTDIWMYKGKRAEEVVMFGKITHAKRIPNPPR